jgi:nucleotide-binding universal stress UspA family protein
MSTPAASAPSADPFQVLAAAKDADILVLGTRGRSHLAGLLLGSVSQICAAAARCPVVLVKREDEFGES